MSSHSSHFLRRVEVDSEWEGYSWCERRCLRAPGDPAVSGGRGTGRDGSFATSGSSTQPWGAREHCKAFNLTRPADPIFQVLLVLNSRSPLSMLFGTLCYFGDFRDATLVCPFPNLDGKDQTIRKMTPEKQTTESSTSFCQRCRTKRSWWAVAKSSCLFWSIVARRTSWLRTTPTFQHGDVLLLCCEWNPQWRHSVAAH